MAGSYNELFEEKHIRVKEVIDFNNGYGIVLGGIHHRLQRCFKNWVKRKRSFIVDYVATQIKVVKVFYSYLDYKIFKSKLLSQNRILGISKDPLK